MCKRKKEVKYIKIRIEVISFLVISVNVYFFCVWGGTVSKCLFLILFCIFKIPHDEHMIIRKYEQPFKNV